MHGFDNASPSDSAAPASGAWHNELTRYHWFVLVVAALGWLFDTMDQQLFNLARVPAMRELLAPSPGQSPNQSDVDLYGGIATMIFLVGWATGGLGFGIMGDRIGRAKTMLITILLYSAFTGLSALSWDIWSFSTFRFLTGLGVGGEFAVGVSLVAEVMPPRARPFALGLLQALSALGNISAALISLALFRLESLGSLMKVGSAWRIMFVIGALPALLAVLIRRRLKEPERWQALSGEELKNKLGSYRELFANPRWSKHAFVGLALAFSGVVGLWGIGFFTIDLNRSVFRKTFEAQAREAGQADQDREFVRLVVHHFREFASLDKSQRPLPNQLLGQHPGNKDPEILYSAAIKMLDAGQSVSAASVLDRLDHPLAGDSAVIPQSASDRELRALYLGASPPAVDGQEMTHHAERITLRDKEMNGRLGFWAGITSVMLNIGAFFGIYAFTYVTHYTGRKPAFAAAFIAALLSTAMVFWYLNEFSQIFWMVPLMGFCQLSLFGGYAIYFPELFPTYLRSTGTSFCYNVGRFVAASGPFAIGLLTSKVFSPANGYAEGMRYAGVTMCSVFLIGLLVLPFAPETKGQALPE